MHAGEIVLSVIAIIVAYLLGSIPSSYLLTPRMAGKNIRQLGGGIGGLNVYRQVGPWTGVAVIAADMLKGVCAVSIAYWLLRLPEIPVLAAGLAAVAGHLWMVFLRLHGGGGISTTVGVLGTLLPIYGYWPELLIFIAIWLLVAVVTRNAVAAMFFAQLFLPLVIWLGTHSLPVILFSIALGVILGLKGLSRLSEDWARADKSMKNLVFHNDFSRNKS